MCIGYEWSYDEVMIYLSDVIFIFFSMGLRVFALTWENTKSFWRLFTFLWIVMDVDGVSGCLRI